jgi:isoleucyl-tRNA synthetase
MNEEQNKSQVALAEEKILTFWKEQNIFQKSLQKDSPQGEFVFFDGPPYATGLPHYGHLLPGTMKDVIPRYKTMKGFHVPRQWGWDCHGLPIENLVQKELNLPTKQDIVDYGVEKFNQAARDSVLRYEKDWKEYIPRVGRFVDMENPYKTMDPEYMESVWAVFKNLQDKGLVYKSYKSMMVSPPLETVLSNQEVNMGGYKDITDISVYANFKILTSPTSPKATQGKPLENAFFVAWTTTPWTLPGNVLLAVGEEIEYSLVSIAEQKYIIASKLLETILAGKEYTIETTIKGKDLVGTTYEPVFPIFQNHKNAFRVVAGDFVTTEDGTGIVHIAPAFGQDDLNLGQKEGAEPIHHVKMDGHFVPEVENFLTEGGYDVKGWAVRNTVDHQHIDVEIVKYLARNGKLFDKKKITHSYPICWRTDCPLINYATESWFVNVQKVKDKLIKNNQKTSWVPNHIKDGRFGKWLEEVRDWSVSRARFWGTPLPIWESPSGKNLFVGSIEDLKKHTKKSGNNYFVMRHGEGTHNTSGIASTKADDPTHLTEKGRSQVKSSAKELKSKNITMIYCSPLIRTKETAEIVTEVLGISKENIVIDDRIKEIDAGIFNSKPFSFTKHFNGLDTYDTPIEGGESPLDVKRRVGEFLNEINSKHKDENILIISHGIFFEVIDPIVEGLDKEKSLEKLKENLGKYTPGTYRDFDFTPLPHNENYELDLHRPFIDEFKLEKDGETYKRIPDVFDVWFDSGSMPYATKEVKKNWLGKVQGLPADFVAEGQDQTRGWFYVMAVLASAQFDQPAFKNVLVNGMVLAEDGKKMSKRLKNYPDMNYMIDKEGADALRLFLMASPAVHAEDVNFSEKGVGEVQSKVMGRLRNSATFYEMYRGSETSSVESSHVLDRWILARLHETNKEIGESLDTYLIDKGARPLFDFVDDLSTWYIRRSRDRFKGEGVDKEYALSTTRLVLKEFAKLSAPFIPFVSEEVYQMVKEESDPESVHLCDWPKVGKIAQSVLESMKKTRELASLGLEARQKAGAKVRQPLQSFATTEKLEGEYLEILKDEINVKEIIVGKEILLDTNITEGLQQEGYYRELLRAIQDLRKKHDLSPKDMIILTVSENGEQLVRAFESELAKLAQVETFVFEDKEGEKIYLDDETITISITKH